MSVVIGSVALVVVEDKGFLDNSLIPIALAQVVIQKKITRSYASCMKANDRKSHKRIAVGLLYWLATGSISIIILIAVPAIIIVSGVCILFRNDKRITHYYLCFFYSKIQ